MDKNSALSLLGLPPGASDADIATAYRQRVTDLKLQLQNAPAGMKSIYERNLEETETAFRYLNTAAQEWLPSAEKVSIAANQATSAKAPPAATTSAGKGLLQPVNKALFAITLASLAAAAFFGLQWKTVTAELKSISQGGELEVLKESFENGTFKIINDSDSLFYIEYFKVAYLENGVLKTHEERPATAIPVEPGRPFETVKREGTQTKFPGKALFYMLTVSNLEGEQRIFTDTFHQDELRLKPIFQ